MTTADRHSRNSNSKLHSRNVEDFIKNSLTRFLYENSNLTKRQLETLLLRSQGLTILQMASALGISKGAASRILKQALRNVRKSFGTLLLLSYAGLISEEEFESFYKLAEAMRRLRGKPELSSLILRRLKKFFAT